MTEDERIYACLDQGIVLYNYSGDWSWANILSDAFDLSRGIAIPKERLKIHRMRFVREFSKCRIPSELNLDGLSGDEDFSEAIAICLLEMCKDRNINLGLVYDERYKYSPAEIEDWNRRIRVRYGLAN